MKTTLDMALTATLVGCAIVTTAILARREFFPALSPVARAQERPQFIKDWRVDFANDLAVGPSSAPVQLVEFADFECPYCGGFYRTLKQIRARHPNQISVTFVNFPIQGHRFALPAARVAECADEQGRFDSMYDQLFESQDQFGLRPWDEYATAAGVENLAAFDACIKKTDHIRRVDEGKALGARLDVRGTPTIIINGWKLGHPPTADELEGMVEAVLAGKSPVNGKS